MRGELMTAREVSEYIHLNMMAVFRLAREGQIPAVEVNGEWRFERKVINDWFGGTEVVSRAGGDGLCHQDD